MRKRRGSRVGPFRLVMLRGLDETYFSQNLLATKLLLKFSSWSKLRKDGVVEVGGGLVEKFSGRGLWHIVATWQEFPDFCWIFEEEMGRGERAVMLKGGRPITSQFRCSTQAVRKNSARDRFKAMVILRCRRRRQVRYLVLASDDEIWIETDFW